MSDVLFGPGQRGHLDRVSPQLWVVIPAFNEETTIADVVGGVFRFCRNVVVIDDGSVDGTAAAAARMGAVVLRHVLNRGQGAALQTGIQYAIRAGADLIVTFDSDGQHSPDDIPRLVVPLIDRSADVVLGSRFLGGSSVPFLRRFVLRAGVLFTRLVSNVAVTDTHNGLRGFSRDAASKLEIRLDRMAHASEILDQIERLRLRYLEVPVQIVYSDYSRRKGQSSLAAVRIAWDFLIGRYFR